jgi:hypothetical protein
VSPPLKRRLVFLIVAVAAVASAAGAYAATQTSPATSRQAFLGDVARRLHVSPQQLRNALQGAFADRLSAAVRAGRLSKAQAAAIEKRLKASGAAPLWPAVGPFLPGPMMVGPGLRARACALRMAQKPAKPGPPPGASAAVAPGLKPGAPPRAGAAVAPGLWLAPGLARKLGRVPGACPRFRALPPGALVPAPGTAVPPGLLPAPGGAVPPGLARKLGKSPRGLHRFYLVPPGAQVPAPRSALPPFAFAPGLGPAFMLGGKAALSYLHISPAKLMADLRAGKSLAQIATAQHRTARGLQSAVESAFRARLNKLVAAGRIPKAMARQMEATLGARVAAIIHAKPGHWAPQVQVPAPRRHGSHRGAAVSPAGAPYSSA